MKLFILLILLVSSTSFAEDELKIGDVVVKSVKVEPLPDNKKAVWVSAINEEKCEAYDYKFIVDCNLRRLGLAYHAANTADKPVESFSASKIKYRDAIPSSFGASRLIRSVRRNRFGIKFCQGKHYLRIPHCAQVML